MTSQLNITTIQNLTGGPVTLTKQSAAKAHLLMDQRGTHLGSAGDTGSSSFNVSSGSDDASGYLTVNFTNNMSNTEYTPVCSSHYNGQDGNKGNARFSGPYTITTSAYSVSTVYSNNAPQDGLTQTVAHGDLA